MTHLLRFLMRLFWQVLAGAKWAGKPMRIRLAAA